MKKHLSTIILVVVFITGLGLMLYPTVSDLVNKAHQSVAINSYDMQIKRMSKEEFRKMLKDAREYNHTITTNEFPRDERDLKGNPEYHASINPSGNGMIGYLRIDSIGVRMPIYHTTDESVLQIGVGHVPTTSLPVGGEGTHAVLTGHRGLPSARLFTDLDKVTIGDIFHIFVLDDILTYEVDQIKTVLPTDTKDLQIVPGKDYVTLVTCTPYGVNTHRLIVRGHRVPYDKTKLENGPARVSEISNIPDDQVTLLLIAACFTVFFIVVLLIKKRRRRDES